MTGFRRVLSAIAVLILMGWSADAFAAPARHRAPAPKQQGINCVQFVKQVTDFGLSGNGWQWWDRAEGVYERGMRPELGSVMVFKRSGRMVNGHIAIVSQLVDERTIRIDHANWAPRGPRKGKIDQAVQVQDISEANDWSLVRMWYEPADAFGRPYPVYGFVHPKNAPAFDNAIRGEPTDRHKRPDAQPENIDIEPLDEATDRTRPAVIAQRPDVRADVRDWDAREAASNE
jgi:hypothetical protein